MHGGSGPTSIATKTIFTAVWRNLISAIQTASSWALMTARAVEASNSPEVFDMAFAKVTDRLRKERNLKRAPIAK
jgi:hypothetical protein